MSLCIAYALMRLSLERPILPSVISVAIPPVVKPDARLAITANETGQL